MHDFLVHLVQQILTLFVTDYKPKEHPYIMTFLKGLGSMFVACQCFILIDWRDIPLDKWLGLSGISVLAGIGIGSILLLLQVIGDKGEKYYLARKRKQDK
ncbi:hypothetical protein PT286_03485 [Neisseriaceae bacterium ESL0693]|nr:hypothetical protein [Neisseriaceae bacterium ESL0693]